MTETQSRADIESVTKQTKWKSEIFDFGKAKRNNVDYFNPSICERPDGRWLIVRRATFSDKDKIGYNDLVAFRLEGTTMIAGFPIQMGKMFPAEHFEDPRAYYVNGRTFISACNFIRSSDKGCTYPHQVMCEVAFDWHLIKRHDPIYGKNGRDQGTNKGHEKNWVWFWKDQYPFLLYQSDPMETAMFSPDFSRAYKNSEMGLSQPKWDASVWQYGHIRGGTPPVLVNGEYWTFFHSSTDIPIYRRQYHMGAMAFESKPPFRVTKITLEPLLSGSRFDRLGPLKPLCCFPCGSILQNNGEWLISFGVNDLDSGWIKIPHKDLEDVVISI